MKQKELRERIIDLGPNQRFKDVLPSIPNKTIIHKAITGVGATYTELVDIRDSIIVLPNIAAIRSKNEKHPNTLSVYEGTTVTRIEEYVKMSATQKILTTPESLSKIIDSCLKLGINPYKKYFLLGDEQHKLIKDVGYRPNITMAMDHFFEFERKALVSATPIMPSDPRFKDQDFEIIRLVPTFAYSKEVEILYVDNHLEALKEVFGRNPLNKQCIFLNSINGIVSAINKLSAMVPGMSNSAIFCSKESVSYLKSKPGMAIKAYAEFEPSRLEKYNFFTSSFYNGLDIEFDELTQVILVTVRSDAKTYFDPFTDSVQAIGRFRQKTDEQIQMLGITKNTTFKDEVIHIVNASTIWDGRYRVDAELEIDTEQRMYDAIFSLYRSTTNLDERSLYQQQLKRLKFHKLLKDERHFNYQYEETIDTNKEVSLSYVIDSYKRDNYLSTERVRRYYSDPEILYNVYRTVGFNPKHTSELRSFEVYVNSRRYYTAELNLDKLSLRGGKRYSKETVKRIADFLLAAENFSGAPGYDAAVFRNTDRYALVRYAYDRIGYNKIVELDYSITKIKQALIDRDVQTGKNKHPLIDSVYNKFQLKIPYKRDYLKRELQSIYDHYNIPIKAKATDLQKWFTVKGSKIIKYLAHQSNSSFIESVDIKDKISTPTMKLRTEARALILLERKFNLHNMLERT